MSLLQVKNLIVEFPGRRGTLRALDDLIRQGKVLYWGTSEWPAAQIKEAARIARHFRDRCGFPPNPSGKPSNPPPEVDFPMVDVECFGFLLGELSY